MDCLLVENPIKGVFDGFALQIHKMQQAKPCILIFQRKRMQGFLLYLFLFKIATQYIKKAS